MSRTIYRLLHRHGWRKLMPRSRHPKADKQVQKQLKNFPAQVEAAVATREAGDERPVLILAQDEGWFGRISRAKRCRASPGVRPHASTQVVREYLYAYAAVAPALGQMVTLILPEASTAMMNRFLEEVSLVFSTHFIGMQVDGAGWHRANDLVVPENIRLIPQPAYSPELNPVEHIWDELREKHFHHRCFPSLEWVMEAICQGLTDRAENSERLRSLTTFLHLNVRRQVAKWYKTIDAFYQRVNELVAHLRPAGQMGAYPSGFQAERGQAGKHTVAFSQPSGWLPTLICCRSAGRAPREMQKSREKSPPCFAT